MDIPPGVSWIIKQLTGTHCLRTAPESYIQSFIEAVQFVYPGQQVGNVLQRKFFIPDDSKFTLDKFLQSAAELSVQNHLKRTAVVQNFAIEKKVNPPKDVDAYYEIGATRVSLEVKCPEEQLPSADSFVVKSAGRVRNFSATADILHRVFKDSKAGHRLETAKNKDNTLRDFLVSGNSKFYPQSGVDDLNILLVACGNEGNIQDWWHYLHGGNGLFTGSSFHPSEDFSLVDVVLLTNLKYFHSQARDFHDWSMNDVFILPCRNPHGRNSLTSESLVNGLSAFNHHLSRFAKCQPKWNRNDRKALDPDIFGILKVAHYIVDELSPAERMRYFPVKPNG